MRPELPAKIPNFFRKTEIFSGFRNSTPTPPISNFFEIFFSQKNSNFLYYFIKQPPSNSFHPKKSYGPPKIPEFSPKGVCPRPLVLRAGTKFSNFDPKFDLYGTLTCAEYESGVRKIFKNFPGTLESHKVLRHFANLAITF